MKRKTTMNKRDMIDIFSILLLALVVSITFAVGFRTCEVLQNGEVITTNCMEINSFGH